MPSVAILAGASGLVGGACLQKLLASPAYTQVISLGRRSLPIQNAKLTQLQVNFDALPPLEEARGAAVFSALGTTIKKAGSQEAFHRVDLEYPLQLARHARAAGAEQFLLVSSVGANPHSSNFYLRVKGEAEDALRQLGFRTLHIFRPSILVGDRAESRPGERFGIALSRALEFAFIAGLRKYRPMPVPLLAQAMLNAASQTQPGCFIHEYDSILQLARA